ncbi:sugar transferase [Paracoccus fontiphilus]|uniref:Sugar transferase n=1 Tax=Paracoccus fontiphilus TaxID=1815556 RepID=A0ABV7IJA3_9RHOB|nr:sugar transferase [Paracoccus fontiphilus]
MTINTRLTEFKPDLALPDIGFSGQVPDRGLYRNGAKWLIEILLVLLTSPVTLPLILLMALLVACDGGNPFFVQKRLGRNGRVFRIWKLRSMVVDAENRLAAHLEQDPEAREQWNSTQKLKQDPRVTPIGAVLRKCSMDELPQLLNVLNGTMSLVGPRPMMVDQQHLYRGRAYYRLRPGITGLWQISARNESEFVERVRYDEDYHRDLSGWLDLKILAKTVVVVLRGTGY